MEHTHTPKIRARLGRYWYRQTRRERAPCPSSKQKNSQNTVDWTKSICLLCFLFPFPKTLPWQPSNRASNGKAHTSPFTYQPLWPLCGSFPISLGLAIGSCCTVHRCTVRGTVFRCTLAYLRAGKQSKTAFSSCPQETHPNAPQRTAKKQPTALFSPRCPPFPLLRIRTQSSLTISPSKIKSKQCLPGFSTAWAEFVEQRTSRSVLYILCYTVVLGDRRWLR